MNLSQISRVILFLSTGVFAHSALGHAAHPVEWSCRLEAATLQDIPFFEDAILSSWSGGDVYAPDSVIPVDYEETFHGLPSIRVDVGDKIEGWWDVHIASNEEWRSIDVTPYVENGRLEFNVKGAAGGEQFRIVFLDADNGRTPQESKLFFSNELFFTMTDDWQHVSIPLAELFSGEIIPLPDGFNLAQITKFGLMDGYGSAPYKKTFWINNIRLTSPDREQRPSEIRLNQVGYLPDGEKYALVAGFPDTLPVCPGARFAVRRNEDDSVAYRGRLELVRRFDGSVSGEKVLRADFSRLIQPGKYYLDVPGTEQLTSSVFEIGADVFASALRDAGRYFYYQRQGMAIEDAFAEGFPRGVGHPGDETAQLRSSGAIHDVSTGWYDGGGFARSTRVAALTIADIVNTHVLFPITRTDHLNIPESGNAIADLVDEARWGLNGLLKMQDSTSGGFYERVSPDRCPKNASCRPEDNVEQRYIEDVINGQENVRPTATTAVAIAALATATRVFAETDNHFADTLLRAASAGWAYLENHPLAISSESPDDAMSDSATRLWAAAELFRTTGSSVYDAYFRVHYRHTDFDWHSAYCNANDAEFRAFVAYSDSAQAQPRIQRWFRRQFIPWRNRQLRRSASTWRNFLNSGDDGFASDYETFSNAITLQMITAIALGDHALGQTPDARLITAARAQLNYLLGANPLGRSYITGLGVTPPEIIYSNIYSNDSFTGLPPGILVGGPNEFEGWSYSRYAGKCYSDTNTDWRVSNHRIDTNATLVFVLSMVNATRSLL
ncbi:MAG: glycoside hydrolase family 9 protein [Deltaproteobacteria bacterium]|nr:glycoside hydrolase family 9 protein [Deltaproteobacteria bacterium]